MPWCLVPELSGAASVLKEFQPPIDGRLQARIDLADALTPEEIAAIPPAMIISRPNAKTLPDVIGWNTGPFLLSPRLKALIEALDPGVHTFKPVAIRTDGVFYGRREHGDYHILITAPRIDALVIEQTDFAFGFGERERGRAGYDTSLARSAAGRGVARARFCEREDSQRTLSARAIGDRHLWRLPEVYWSRLMCSDHLRDEMKREKMRGWDFQSYFRLQAAGV